MSGFILESRKILDSDIWHKPPLYFKVWHYLLLKAKYAKQGNLERGQLFVNINEIREECSYYVGYRKVTPTRQEIHRIFDWLRSSHEDDGENDKCEPMIVTKKVTHGFIVTIVNYGIYQDPDTYEKNNEHDKNKPAKETRKGREDADIKKKERKKEEVINNIGRKFVKPTVDQVRAYCRERNNNINPESFIDYYEARGWKLNKGLSMKDWKAAVRTWERNDNRKNNKFNNHTPRQTDMNDLEKKLLATN